MYRHHYPRRSPSKNQDPSTTTLTQPQYYRYGNFDAGGGIHGGGRLVYFFPRDDDEEESKDSSCMDRPLNNKDRLGLTTATPATTADTARGAVATVAGNAGATKNGTNLHHHHEDRDDHDDDDFETDDDSNSTNNSVSLFQVEECSLIHVPLLDRPRTLALAQYNSLHQDWGIYSTIWDGGIALLRYVCDLHSHDAVDGVIGGERSTSTSTSSDAASSLSATSDGSSNSKRNAATEKVVSCSWRDLTVIDIGSGTGLVGLGIAAASKGKALVAVTDLPLAMPLLKENVQLNRGHWTLGRQVQTPECHVLPWGQEFKDDDADGTNDDNDDDDCFPSKWLEQFLERGEASSPSSPPPPPASTTDSTLSQRQTSKRKKKSHRSRRYLITAADVIYRKSLFEPLLITLTALWTKLGHYAARTSKSSSSRNRPLPQVDCLLACQSIRGHLDEFWTMARSHGFDMQRIALVDLAADTAYTSSSSSSSPHAKVDLGAAVTTHLTAREDRRLPPVTHTEKREGRLWIIRLEKLPYTFDI
jgi:predicted nicotinamide N-methyase